MINANSIKYLAFFLAFNCHANQEQFKFDELVNMTLTELLELEVITPSRVKQRLIDSPANITVITQAMMRQRGYKNLIEVLQDLPGFDFATFEDGGGEYPNHALNRGIGGGPGNPKLLVLVDGIAQNHISFNWSQLLGEEQIYQDLDRIEVIQGPVSAIYGANAFSGIIHFITQRRVKANKLTSTVWLGEDNTRAVSAFAQSKFDNIHINGAFKLYQTDGDMGLGRPDPAGYFHNNVYPQNTTADFDNNRQYHAGSQSPFAGQSLTDGFNTNKDNWSLRANINYFSSLEDLQTTGLVRASAGLFIWNKKEGLGSYVPGFEYQTTNDSFKVHHGAQMFSFDADYRIKADLMSTTNLWYRQNRQLPQTGFQYTYRYPQLIKSYHSLNTLWGVEQQFKWQLDNTDVFQLGLRFVSSEKMDQVVSLGQFQEGHDPVTTSSWSGATSLTDQQLGASERVQVYSPNEQALYATYDGQLSETLSYSAGVRVDHSDDYGSTTNPRVGFIYKVPNELFTHWNLKFLYGEAFREPSVFELTDEFRGNIHLVPEEIKTYEMISQFNWQSENPAAIGLVESMTLNASVFYSDMQNLITLVQSAQSEGGSAYANAAEASVRGFTLALDAQLTSQLSIYTNYQFTQGNQNDHWQAVEHTARNKWNIGLNWLTLDDKLNISLRSNIVGSRKVPVSNGYYTDYAPGYEKTHLTLSWNDWHWGSLRLSPQVVVKNVFDEAYAGVGRQDGRSDASQYDPLNNPNPEGFVPGYHPQPGRTVLLNLRFEF